MSKQRKLLDLSTSMAKSAECAELLQEADSLIQGGLDRLAAERFDDPHCAEAESWKQKIIDSCQEKWRKFYREELQGRK